MASTSPPTYQSSPEMSESPTRSSRRPMSNGSDFSPPPSDDASSTASDVLATVKSRDFLWQPSHNPPARWMVQKIGDAEVHIEHARSELSEQNNPSIQPRHRMSTDDNTFPGYPTSMGPSDSNAGTKPNLEDTIVRSAPRRFVPEPVETSTRSSKKETKTDEDTDQPTRSRKRFAPQPVETSTRSSKSNEQEAAVNETNKPKRRFAPEPVETSTRKSKDREKEASATDMVKPKRRFAPEPLETSTRSSKATAAADDGGSETARPRRKFAPEPVETTSRSSKNTEESETSGNRPRRKFAPEPIETTTVRRRRSTDDVRSDSTTPSRSSSGGRRFTPELVETAKGSYRRSVVASAVPKHLRPSSPNPHSSEEKERNWEAPDVPESRFSAAALSRRSRSETRQHSYSVPHLPIIESDSSDEESDIPMTDTPTTPDTEHRRLSKVPEGNDISYTDYVFRMASQMDEKELRERAMAAYINEYQHEPVMHFAAEEDEDEPVAVGTFSGDNGASPSLFRRQSHEDLDLAMEDMRRHHQQLEKAKREFHEDTAGASRFSAAALAARHHLGVSHPHPQPKKAKGAADEASELAKMRAAASPPMLGGDLVFPLTISPKMTRCDVDQAPRPRRADSGSEEETDVGQESLWSVHTNKSSQSTAGLWGGLCKKSSNDGVTRPTTPIRSGLQTPAFERGDPFGSHTPKGARTPGRRNIPAPWSGMGFLPLTPPRSTDGDSFTSSIDRKLQMEQQIEEEFPNQVITQIYNYLSLGYPSLARPFDEELSKISRISLYELRKGDRNPDGNVRGYIGSPEGEGSYDEDDNGAVRGCRRWEALRLYVREWARQSPNFASERSIPGGFNRNGNVGGWGANAPVRKGSWGQ